MLKKFIRNTWLVNTLLHIKYKYRFKRATKSNLFYGIYPDFQTCNKHLPKSKPPGYDNQASAELYEERAHTIYINDYPVLYWLKQILNKSDIVFEIGGHIGVSFYSYDHFMNLDKDIHWTIQEVEHVANQGKKIANKKNETRLHFTHTFDALKDTKLVFASGSLQYIEEDILKLIHKANINPEHILINMFPLNDKPDYYTINNIGTAFCPYKITNKDQFIQLMNENGYKLIDEWKNEDKYCTIPFSDPSYSLDHYHGFYFNKQ